MAETTTEMTVDPFHNAFDPGPSRKRVRVTRACDTCRRRKERCDGTQPTCRRCTEQDRPCSYNPYKKRGLRTGYVRAVEILLGLLIHSIDGVQDLVLSVLENVQESQQLPKTPLSVNGEATTSLLDSWRKSAAFEVLEKVLGVPDSVQDEESYLRNLDNKLTSTFNSLSRHRHRTETRTGAPNDTVQYDSTFRLSQLSPAPSIRSPQQLPSQLHPSRQESILRIHTPPASSVQAPLSRSFDIEFGAPILPRPPDNWLQLIEAYVTYTHCWLPIVPKFTLFRSASLLADQDGQTTSNETPSPGEVASLWAVLATGSYQRFAIRNSSHNTDFDQRENQNHFSKLHEVSTQLAIQHQAQYDHGNVHACLILSLLDMYRGLWQQSWLWVGRAIYIAVGMNLIPLKKKEDAGLISEKSKCLFLGCFILDTLLAEHLGVRPYFDTTDLVQMGNITTDGMEEWEIWRPASESLAPSVQQHSSERPGRVLSTFNKLGQIIGSLNNLSRMPKQIPRQHGLEELLGVFVAQRKEEISAVDEAWQGGSVSIQQMPPHIKQLQTATAAVYARLTAEFTYNSIPLPERINNQSLKNTNKTIKMLANAIDEPSTVASGFYPPTLKILINLLKKNEHQLHQDAMDVDWAESATHISPVSDTLPSTLMDSLLPDHVISQDSARCVDESLHSSLAEAPCHDTEGIKMPFGGIESVPAPTNQSHELLTSDENGDNISVDPDISSFPPGIITQTDICDEVHDDSTIIVNTDSEDTPTTVSFAEVMSQSELFSQLSSLDTLEWPVVSDDFMEHLGLSREDSFGDLQARFL